MRVAGFRMHYLDEGSGPVVLLLHGNPTWCFYYRGLIEVLRENFRVIAPDFIGLGLSDHPAHAHFRASHRIEQLEDFVRQLGLARYSLVMHDWGGSIGTALAVRSPAAVEKLVYLNTTLTETETLPLLIKTAARPLIGKLLTKYTKRFLNFTTTLGVAKKLPKQIRKAYAYPYRGMKRRTAIWDFVADIPFDSNHPTYKMMLELADGLPALDKAPVQIVWGLRDPCFHRGMLNKVSAHFPQARVLEIPEASHLVLEDAPQLACSTIRDFLLGVECSGSDARYSQVGVRGASALYRRFCRSALERPQQNAAVVPSFLGDSVKYAQINFDALYSLMNQYQRGLAELGLRRGDKVLMLVAPGLDFLALSYAVMGRGAVPIYLDPGMGKEKLLRCIAAVRPDAFIASPKAHLLRLLKRKLFRGVKFHVTVTDWICPGSTTTAFFKKFSSKGLPEVASTGTCLIAYTSGATGTPKGVIFTDEMIEAQLDIFSGAFQLQAGRKDLPLLPIFSLYTVALGICSVFPPVDPARPLALDPLRVVRIINELHVDYSFGSPTLWNKIAEYCVRSRTKLPSLKQVFMAGAPVSRSTIERVHEILEEGRSATPYGATEALPVTLVDAEEVLRANEQPAASGEIGTLVGKSVQGVELRVIALEDGSIPQIDMARECAPGEIGEVIVRGRNVSPAYFELPEATARTKIMDGASFWHRMGDVGYLDRAGNFYFCGRKAHAVKTAGRTYYSVPTERIFNRHPRVWRSALVALGPQPEAAIVVEPYPQDWPEQKEEKARFEAELRALAAADPLTAGIERFFFHRAFPVDGRHNAKIFRDQLGEWASRQSVQDTP